MCSAPDSTGSKLQYEPHLFSVACFQTKLSISVKILGDLAKCRSQKKLKSLIEVPYVVHVKVHVLGLYTEKAKNVDRGSLCSAHESTGSKLQYEPHLFSSAFLDRVIHLGEN